MTSSPPDERTLLSPNGPAQAGPSTRSTHKLAPGYGAISITAGNDERARADAAPPVYLYDQAMVLIVRLMRSERDISPSIEAEAEAEDNDASDASDAHLCIYLYALSILHRPFPSQASDVSLQARLRRTEQDRIVREELYERIECFLDRFTELEDELGDEDERLQSMFWGRWKVVWFEDKWVNAIDLLLPPYTRSEPSPFLSHPVIRHILDHAWAYGVPLSPSSLPGLDDGHEQPRPISIFRRLVGKIGRLATPSRLHTVHLLSFIVLYSLTLSIALRPGRWITPYPSDTAQGPGYGETSISMKEIIWAVWAGSSFVASIQLVPLLQRLLLLPTHLAFLCLFAPLRNLTYPLINLSIPTLTFLLVLPIPPALPFALKELLPLSVLLRRILSRAVRTAGLLMPLVLLLFLVFGWSMNGDVFRGFFVAPGDIVALDGPYHPSSPVGISYAEVTSATDDGVFGALKALFTGLYHRALQLTSPSGAYNGDNLKSLAEPVEDGISPYAARLSLFLTLTLLFLFSCLLSAARALSAPVGWDERRRWRGGLREGDDWECEGGREARAAWAEGVRRYVWDGGYGQDTEDEEAGPSVLESGEGGVQRGSPVALDKEASREREPIPPFLPVPLNLVSLPLDVTVLVLPKTCASGRIRRTVVGWRYHLGAILAGLACLPLSLIGRVLGAR